MSEIHLELTHEVWGPQHYTDIALAMLDAEPGGKTAFLPYIEEAERNIDNVQIPEWGDPAGWSANQRLAFSTTPTERARAVMGMYRQIPDEGDKCDELLRYLRWGTFVYNIEAAKNVAARASHARSPEEIIPSLHFHDEHHESLKLREQRLAKARKATHREKIRNTLHKSPVVDANIFEPVIGALVRIDSVGAAHEQLLDVEQRHSHEPLTTGLAYFRMIEAAKKHEKDIPGAIFDTAERAIGAMPRRLQVSQRLAAYMVNARSE